jgi:hypothetical protein
MKYPNEEEIDASSITLEEDDQRVIQEYADNEKLGQARPASGHL